MDGLSDDGQFGLTIIAFVGSVFSPYYHWSGRSEPDNHCAINVCLYGPGARRWTMTERGKTAVTRDASHFAVGPSSLTWDGTALTIDLNEVGMPIPQRARGRITVHPGAMTENGFALDAKGAHRWWPIAPSSRIEVDFQDPALRWSGHGYLDSNCGDEPIEDAFATWDWSRTDVKDGCAVLYDTRNRDGSRSSVAVHFSSDGTATDFEAPPRQPLKSTFWQVKRGTQADGDVRIRQTLEDTPFYARSVLETTVGGRKGLAVHESIDLDRLKSPIVKLMLPWRMPRRFI
ncbi:MAG: carotenoid 1,2-hydratase [Pseudomonadota bacterium]